MAYDSVTLNPPPPYRGGRPRVWYYSTTAAMAMHLAMRSLTPITVGAAAAVAAAAAATVWLQRMSRPPLG